MKRITMMLMVFAMTPLMALETTLSDGLVAHYKFDGNANDSSGNGNDGVVHGATLTEDRFGNPNSAYLFDGNSWIEVRDSASLHGVSNAFTVSCWVRINEWDDMTAPVVCKGTDYELSDRQFGLTLLEEGYWEVGVAGEYANVVSFEKLGKWIHYVGVRRSNSSDIIS